MSIEQSSFEAPESEKQAELKEPPVRYAPTNRLSGMLRLCSLLFGLAGISIFMFGEEFLTSTQILKFDGLSWEPQQEIAVDVSQLAMSETGRLWALTKDGSLYAFKNDKWEKSPVNIAATKAPSGIPAKLLSHLHSRVTEMRASADDVWVKEKAEFKLVHDNHVTSFRVDQADYDKSLYQFLVYNGDLWVVTDTNKLLRRRENTWEVQSLPKDIADLLPRSSHFFLSNMIAVSPESEPYFIYGDVWKQSHGHWQKVEFSSLKSKYFRLLDFDRNGVWLLGDNEIVLFGFDGMIKAQFARSSIPIEFDDIEATSYIVNGSLVFVSEDHLAEFSPRGDVNVRSIPLQTESFNEVRLLAMKDSGQLWAIGSAGMNSEHRFILAVSFMMIPGILAVFFFGFCPLFRPKWAVEYGLYREYQEASVSSTPLPSTFSGPSIGQNKITALTRIKPILWQAGISFTLTYYGVRVGLPVPLLIAQFPAIMLLALVPVHVFLLPLVNSCEYEKALARADLLVRLGLSLSLTVRGNVLLVAGRFEEAEVYYRGVLEYERHNLRRALSLFAYARALLGLGRFTDARRACIEALARYPAVVSGNYTAAEICLEENSRPEQAVEYLKTAASIYRKRPYLHLLSPEELATILFLQAWALASMKQIDEAQKTLDHAFKKIRVGCRPDHAKQLYYAARTYELLGKADQAHDALTKCCAVDPKGAAGLRGTAMLLRRRRSQ